MTINIKYYDIRFRLDLKAEKVGVFQAEGVNKFQRWMP